jgi:hypothetical protein
MLLFNKKKKKKFSFPADVFSFCIVVLFYSKKKKKSSACLCLFWKQNKPFFKWFSLTFSSTKKKKKKRTKKRDVHGDWNISGEKKKSFFLISMGAILCLLVQLCAILVVRACAILSLWVPVTGYGWDMRQPIGVSPVEFVSDRLWLCCVAYILVRILKESVGILWWFRQF